ncbi:MAG TPA: hypothetical protein VMT03_07330 [Polyangia bacterium]|nr:hypothetical protein [Polyangia bacterium]
MSVIIGLLVSVCSLVSNGAPVCRPVPSAPLHDPRLAAREQMSKLVAGIQHIERIRAKTPADLVDRSCVDAKLAEARVGLQIAGDEMARLEASVSDNDVGEQEYAMRRMRMLVDRTSDLTHAAQICATEEASSIDVTSVEVVAPSGLPPDSITAPGGPAH